MKIYKVIEPLDLGEWLLEEPNEFNADRAKTIPLFLYLLYKISIPLYNYVQAKLSRIEEA
jgi:hypothetical protein